MRKYKDSEIEWIGKIPEDWNLSRLKFVLRNPIETGKRPNEPEGNILSIGGEHIQNGCFDLSHPMYVSETTFSDNKGKIQLHDTLVVKDGATIGKCMYVKDMPKEKMLLNEHVYRISCSKFYYYWILSEIAQKWFRVRNQSTAQESITGPTIMNLPVIVSSQTEQQRIADYLDDKCGEIDSLIGLQEQMIEKLKAYKQSVITEAVTKGLDPNAKLVASGIDWIGEIPEGWSKDKIVRCFQKIGSGTTPKSTDDNLFQGNINWLQSGDINGGNLYEASKHISEKTLANYSALSVYQAPFIIIAMYGASVGNISISHINACVNQACCVLSGSNLDFNYAFYALKSAKSYLIYRAEGGGQPNISQDKLRSLWIPRPPMTEQISIASYLDEQCADIDKLIDLKQQKIEKLKDYKKSVIYEAVTGKINIE